MSESPQPRSRPKWVPNALVILRLVLAAVFVALLSIRPLASTAQLVAGAILFLVAALTDMLDGKLARAWDAITRFGRVMDPFADKILVLGAFVCLAGPAFALDLDGRRIQASGVEPWMVVVILGRELLITSLRALVEGEGRDFSAIPAGKLKMILQSAAVPLILLILAWGHYRPGEIGRWIILFTAWATVVVTVLSGIPYLQRALGRPRAAMEPPPS
ncbi:MAG TPA: CDP-alcohol phosphatidyltransferase family protein [Phycisphaerales bacterium]|nr:CDP-alcohol phosphatidyltransferase family protein [Phycisphaerales bacterium]